MIATPLSVSLFGLLGLVLGSFANAVASRYDPDRFIFAPVRGRSRCTGCDRTLGPLELVPVLSWIALRGRCRGCGVRLSVRYPLSEIGTALAVMSVPLGLQAISAQFLDPWRLGVALGCWVLIVVTLAIVTLIDLDHYLIPDEAVIAIAVLGAIAAGVTAPIFTDATGSFLGSYAMLAGLHHSALLGHLVGMLAAGGVLLCLYAVTRGKGIGFGDVKLAAALGIAFAWPDSIVLVGLAFVLGSLAAVPALIMRRAKMRTALPFGPFLALAAVLLLAFGTKLASAYFGLLLL